MKLIMTYDVVSGPDCWGITQPFEYESLEAAYVDFMDLLNKYRKQCKENTSGGKYQYTPSSVKFAGFDIDLCEFGSDREPKIQTLEEWFEENKSPSNYSLGINKA